MRGRSLLVAVAAVLLWAGSLLGCNSGGGTVCTGPHDCAVQERCYEGKCVFVDKQCNNVTCSDGCCQPDGTCVQERRADACGNHGAACSACPAGMACNGAGVCAKQDINPPPGKCDANSCPKGCCKDGKCVDPQTDARCGIQGATCFDCGSIGQFCATTTGQCIQQQKCDPTTCAGCCQGNTCVTGSANDACGKGGQSCLNCVGAGLVCEPTKRVCDTGSAGTCDAKSCADGCCDGQGNCVKTATATTCGKGGVACIDCSAQNQICAPSGSACAPATGTCDSSNCDGCCDGASCVKKENLSKSQCGSAGQACTDCSKVGNVCEKATGTCAPPPPCNAITCPSGCCRNGQCEVLSASACGKPGAACVTCNAGEVCNAGTCGPKAPKCSASNCGGCCDGDTCVESSQTTAQRCGTGGAACQACSAGQTCNAGACGSNASYPPGPYATSVGSTLKNLTFKKCGGGAITNKDHMFNKHKVVVLFVTSGAS